jgi:hypothetical protein
VHQLLVILVDLGLELTELLELGPSRPHGGRHRGLLSCGSRGECLLKRSVNALPYGGGVPWGNLLYLQMKAFT